MRFVPASCKRELQPFDLSGNDKIKTVSKISVLRMVCSQVDRTVQSQKS